MKREDFPIYLVRVMASHGCCCQVSGRDLDLNVHVPSCTVGQAQWYLGRRVTWELNGVRKEPPFRAPTPSEVPVT